jgi:hypothetical protein
VSFNNSVVRGSAGGLTGYSIFCVEVPVGFCVLRFCMLKVLQNKRQTAGNSCARKFRIQESDVETS